MNEIEELQQRISTALARVGQGVEGLAAAQSSADEALRQELEEERTVSAQLSERVRTVKARADDDIAAMRSELDQSAAQMAQLDLELQKVRRVNDQLREACAALRAANAEGVGDADLINAGLVAELDGLRAARAADVAEASAIISALSPLVDAASQTAAPRTETSGGMSDA